MSTKATIVHGPNFHLYHEALADDYVYLEIEGTPYEAGYNRIVVSIPIHVWEVIRHYPGIQLKYADKAVQKSETMLSKWSTSVSNSIN